ncbi:triple functional domain protein isoform X2 [Drosophila novamexicana]|uniref:triple functional domain protein isoform X2 n=1 Tax=Drosophila novamexicana TaxID=47314 RepID=UPI0011E599DE|nr:triple functional domain protein isoform X2 [Drosophila novamexicana]
MKSVKKFLNERINSVDAADVASQKKTTLERLKCGSDSQDQAPGSAGGGSQDQAPASAASLPNTPLALPPLSAPIAIGDPSPSPSLADSAQNTPLCTLEEDDSTSPKLTATAASAEPLCRSPFTFPTVPPAAGTPQQRKSRRKISLPWFRQSSVSSHGTLSRQHTIDTPSSFRFFRQPSNSGFKLGNQEATWVVADYIASSGSNELSVSKGQQVEIIEPPTASEPDFCLVRLNPQHDDSAVQEGLVPVAVLKPPPGAHKQGSSGAAATAAAAAGAAQKPNNDNSMQDQGNRGKADALSSSTKRRGFSGRKWLPQPLRKLSQTKVEKSPNEKALLKKPSEKNLRLTQKHTEELAEQTGSGASGGVGQMPPQFPNVSAQHQPDFEPEEEAGLELPPPMKPIQEPHLMANGPPAFPKDLKENSANLASTGKIEGNPLSEIEQIVRMSREQHESNSRVDGSVAGEAGGEGTGADNAATNGRAELGFVQDNNDKNKPEASDSEAGALSRRQLVLNELVATEESYVQDLQKIVYGYMKEIHNKEIPRPADLQGGKMDLVFNNIKEIYEWHRDKFLRSLRHCQKSPADLGPLIDSSTKKFPMYYYFCSNKPLSEFIVNAHYQYFDQIRQKLGHRMDLSTLIITPVQRITKYGLLIEQILRETKRAGLHNEVPALMKAWDQMKDVVKKVDDMMDVLRGLQDFDGEITAQGNLLLQGTLTCAIDAGQKQRELQVFLFQQIMIFADIQKAKTQYTSPIYKYRTHIQLNHMQLEPVKEGDYIFRVKSTDPNKPTVSIECQASSEKCYDEWLGMLNVILEQQSDLITRLVNPLNK